MPLPSGPRTHLTRPASATRLCTLLLFALASAPSALGQTPLVNPPAIYNHGEPTGAEQQTLQLINRGRRDSVAESYRLAEIANFALLQSYYHTTRDQFLGEFRGLGGGGYRAYLYPPRQPLAFNSVLIDAARRQNAKQINLALADQQINRLVGDGLSSLEYATQAGYEGVAGENIAFDLEYPGVSGVISNENALVFDVENINPNSPLGHRLHIFGNYSEVGIAVDHRFTGQSLDVETRVDTFGVPSDNDYAVAYLSGVVFEDTDLNGQYTPGEGLAGVMVQPDHGYWRAFTSSSGGYAIPLNAIADVPFNTNPGAPLPAGDVVTLTFSGGSLREPITRTVTLTGKSMEVNVAQPQPEGVAGFKRPNLSAIFTPETGVSNKVVQGALRLTNLGKKNTGTFRVVVLLADPGTNGVDLTGAKPLAEFDVPNVGKKGAVLDIPLVYQVGKNTSGRTLVALVDVLETVCQTERDGLRPTLTLP